MMDIIFRLCVGLLVWLAAMTGTTYNEINVIIFCVIWPLFTLGLVALCLVQRAQIRRLRRLALPDRKGEGEKMNHVRPAVTKAMTICMRLLIWLAYAAFAMAVAPVSAWVLWHAVTWVGTCLSLLGLVTVILPLVWRRLGTTHSRRLCLRWGTLIFYVTVLALIGFQVPSGRPRPESPIQHRFSKGPIPFPQYSPFNVIPESEQFNMGFLVMPFLDSEFTFAQAGQVSGPTRALYREMEADPDCHALGSAMVWAYPELWGESPDVGHYYLYVPKHRQPGPIPAMVFLHGSLGNFKPYTWILSHLAEKHGMVIISPSFGMGNWHLPESRQVVERALEDAARVTEIDRSRVYLAGISNGGLGVSQVADALPDRFCGLIFISAVFDREIAAPHFLKQWQGRPVLVLAGEKDERIPFSWTQEQAALLKAGKVKVTVKSYPGEDHFLFFTHWKDLVETMSTWMDSPAP